MRLPTATPSACREPGPEPLLGQMGPGDPERAAPRTAPLSCVILTAATIASAVLKPISRHRRPVGSTSSMCTRQCRGVRVAAVSGGRTPHRSIRPCFARYHGSELPVMGPRPLGRRSAETPTISAEGDESPPRHPITGRKGLAEVEPQRIDTGTVSRWTGWPVPRTMDAIRRADSGGRTPKRS
jgi:hypothetical protein